MRVPTAARILVAATATAGFAVVAVAASKVASAPLATLAVLGAAVVLTELLQVPGTDTTRSPEEGYRFSFSSAIHVAAIILLGPWLGGLIAASGVLVVDRLRDAQWTRIAFNAATFATAAFLGGTAFELLGGRPGSLELPADFLPIGGLVVVYSGVNLVLVGSIIALTSGRSPLPELRAQALSELSPRVAEAALGVAVAFCAVVEPAAIIVLLPLIFAVYQAHARLVLLHRETARALEAFANVVDERDPSTYRHSARVSAYVRELGSALGLPPDTVARFSWAGRLHDLGKVAVDAGILRKPAALSEEEWRVVRLHPRLSARILRRFRLAREEARAIEYHHERFDGRGYYGLPSEDLPLGAHLLLVADSFDAMTSDRPYRLRLRQEEALAEIEAGSGTQFHPAVAKAFVAVRRGQPPLEALSPQERQELRRMAARRPQRSRYALDRHLARAPEALFLVGLLVSLAAVGLERLDVGIVGILAAAAGILWRHVVVRGAEQLVRALVALSKAETDRHAFFDGVAYHVSATSPLAWAGLVEWDDHALDGRIEREWGDRLAGPRESSLVSLLVRELDEPEAVIAAVGDEVGSSGAVLALPLRTRESITGFAVFLFAHAPARHVAAALGRSAVLLNAGLARPGAEIAVLNRTIAAAS